MFSKEKVANKEVTNKEVENENTNAPSLENDITMEEENIEVSVAATSSNISLDAKKQSSSRRRKTQMNAFHKVCHAVYKKHDQNSLVKLKEFIDYFKDFWTEENLSKFLHDDIILYNTVTNKLVLQHKIRPDPKIYSKEKINPADIEYEIEKITRCRFDKKKQKRKYDVKFTGYDETESIFSSKIDAEELKEKFNKNRIPSKKHPYKNGPVYASNNKL